jgi:dynein heavy chain
MEPESLTLKPLVKSWLHAIPEKIHEKPEIIERLRELYENILDDGCYYMRKQCIEPVTTVDNNICQSSFRILDCTFAYYVDTEIKKITPEELDQLHE